MTSITTPSSIVPMPDLEEAWQDADQNFLNAQPAHCLS
jgi:hypothetical protein